MTHVRYPLLLLCTLFVGGGLISGCDQLTTPEADTTPVFVREASPLVTPEGLRMSQLAPDQVFDPAIDQTDTYVVAEAVVQQMVDIEDEAPVYLPAEEHHTEAGFTSGGSLVFSDYRLDTPGDPYTTPVDEPRIVRTVGDAGYFYDVNGQPLPTDAEYAYTPQQMLADVGLQVTEGLIVEQLSDDEEMGPSAFGVDAGMGAAHVTRKGATITVEVQSGHASADSVKSRLKRTYKKKGDLYILDEAITEVEMPRNGRRAVRATMRMKMRRVQWQRNAAKDNERKGKGRASTPVAEVFPPPIPPPPCEPTDEGCATGGGGGGSSAPDPCAQIIGAPMLIFQHGIKSDGDAWLAGGNGVVYRDARCKFVTGETVRHSMANSGFNSHATQLTELRNDVLGRSATEVVFVGHSQGGVISRRLAQEFHPQSGTIVRTVRGVVTIDTPNKGAVGANIMDSPATQAAMIAAAALALPTDVPRKIGRWLGFLGQVGVSGAILWLDVRIANSQALVDLKVGSASITSMNTTYETFRRFAIRSAPKARWMPFRMVGDLGGARKGDLCVVRAWTIFGYATAGTLLGLFSGNLLLIKWCVGIALGMTALDVLVHLVATGSGGAYDGIVRYDAQEYPTNAPGHYPPVTKALEQRPVSHVGVQSSEEASVLLQGFMSQMDIAPR